MRSRRPWRLRHNESAASADGDHARSAHLECVYHYACDRARGASLRLHAHIRWDQYTFQFMRGIPGGDGHPPQPWAARPESA